MMPSLAAFLDQVELLVARYGHQNITPFSCVRTRTFGFVAAQTLPDGQVQKETVAIGINVFRGAFSGPAWTQRPGHAGATHLRRERPDDDVIVSVYRSLLLQAFARGQARHAPPQSH